MESIELGDVSETAWSAFQRGAADQVPAPLRACWSRARRLGAQPEGPPHEEGLLRGGALREQAERLEELREVGARVLDRSGGWLGRQDYLMLLADHAGVVVHTAGGGAFSEEARRVRLMAGASWSEAVRGTNAIGTALAEQRPVTVVGRAHYGRAFHNLVCYAAPIWSPDGRVVGVLDATSLRPRADAAIGVAVASAAQAIEESLRARAYAGAGRSVARALFWALEQARVPVLLVEPPGRVVRGNVSGRLLLDGASVGGPVTSVLGLDWVALASEALRPTAGGLTLVVAGQPRRLRTEPILGPSDELLSVVAILEPVTTSTRPAVPAPTPTPPPPSCDPFGAIFADDVSVSAGVQWARRVAVSRLPVMLLAETGSGKELFAQAIHGASDRAGGPFVAINCGAIAAGLLESELFGHAPGAFTGADRRGRAGLLHAADRGTLFLDEVAEMAPSMQAALLRFLETGTYQRLGETTASRVDVRVVCATCRDLPAMVAAGTFRQDLYYRLKGALLRLPPLRERSDIDALARALLARLASPRPAPHLSPDAIERLRQHPWPGNVRELKMALEVALVMSDGGDTIETWHLPDDIGPVASATTTPVPPSTSPLARAEGEQVRRALSEADGNISAAAQRLGVARSTLYRMLRRHGLLGSHGS